MDMEGRGATASMVRVTAGSASTAIAIAAEKHCARVRARVASGAAVDPCSASAPDFLEQGGTSVAMRPAGEASATSLRREVDTMKYLKPELIVVGSASALVQGGLEGVGDNTNGDIEKPMSGVVLGLDD